MKRLNFNHVGLKSLFVVLVMTFMGAVSVSAQNYYPNGQAATIIGNELNTLSQGPAKATPTTPQVINGGNLSGQADPQILTDMKIIILQSIMEKLKHGSDTGSAIDETFSPLQNGVVGDRALKLTTVKNYVIDLLS